MKPDSHDIFAAGDKLDGGHYTVIKELGQGGMGVVFHCHDELLQRDVAIKMLLPELMQNQGNVEVFHQEARLAAQLEHPNIVTIFEIGKEDRKGKARHYIAMEYLPGGTLSGRISPKETSTENALNWMKQLSNGLSFAHKRGVVHQDIKSDNIFITMEGDLKIGDFGLARLAQGRAKSNTRRGMGTPAYMSPELCRGEPQDHRSDIYSMGVLFYEMVTGELPFKARGMIEMAMKHASAPIPSTRKMNPNVPEVLDKLIQKMMAKTPDERYQSMQEILTILDDLIFELRVARLGLSGKRNIRGVNVSQDGSSGFFSSAPPQGGRFFTASRSNDGMDSEPLPQVPPPSAPERKSVPLPPPQPSAPERRSAQIPQPDRISHRDIPLTKSPPAEPYIAANSSVESQPSFQARISMPRNSVDVPSAAARATGPTTSQPVQPQVVPERKKEIQLLWQAKVEGPIGWSCSPVADKDEKHIYICSTDGRVSAFRTAGGDRIWSFETDGPILSTPVTIGDNLLVSSADGCIYCLSADTGRKVWIYRHPAAFISSPVLHQDVLFAATIDGDLSAVDAVSGTLRWQHKAGAPMVGGPQIYNKAVICASRDQNCYALNINNGAVLWSYNAGAPLVASPRVSGDRIYFGAEDGQFTALDAERGRIVWEYSTNKPILSRAVVVFTGVIFAGQDRWLYCCEKYDGRLLWKSALRGRAIANLATSGSGTVYVTSREGFVQAFNAQTGDQRWMIQTDKHLESAPLITTSENLYVGSIEGDVFAYSIY